MELATLLGGLAREFRSIEATGPTQWTKAHFVGGAKHDAWAKLKGTDQAKARENYIKLVERLKKTYG